MPNKRARRDDNILIADGRPRANIVEERSRRNAEQNTQQKHNLFYTLGEKGCQSLSLNDAFDISAYLIKDFCDGVSHEDFRKDS